MNRIPVGQTIGEAYRFAFAGFFGNLGVVWLPLSLLAGLFGYFLMPTLAQYITALPIGSHDPEAIKQAVHNMLGFERLFIPFWLVTLFVEAQVMTGLTRRALGLSNGASVVYLSLGANFWRVFGAYLAVAMILYALTIVLVIAALLGGVAFGLATGFGAGAAGMSHLGAGILGGGAGLLVSLIVILAAVYIAVRLSFLLTACIVDEQRFDLLRPWEMARGNVLRIVAIGLAVLIPLAILDAFLMTPAEIFVVAPALSHLPADPQAMTDAQTQQFVREFFGHLSGALRERWYVLLPVVIVARTFLYGGLAGAGAAAWRALVPGRG